MSDFQKTRTEDMIAGIKSCALLSELDALVREAKADTVSETAKA